MCPDVLSQLPEERQRTHEDWLACHLTKIDRKLILAVLPQEDRVLTELVIKHGPRNWSQIAEVRKPF